jgi:hypothetical protein
VDEQYAPTGLIALTKKVVVEVEKEMMNDEQGISNVEVIVRVLFLHHSSLTSSNFASLFDTRHSIKSQPSLSVQLMSNCVPLLGTARSSGAKSYAYVCEDDVS